MAHHFKIQPRPYKKKDGTLSETKKEYVVIDRARNGSSEVGVATSVAAAENLITVARKMLHSNHLKKHPNDTAFQTKHGYKGVNA